MSGTPENRVYTPPVRTIRTCNALFGVPVSAGQRSPFASFPVRPRPDSSGFGGFIPQRRLHTTAQIQAHCALRCAGVQSGAPSCGIIKNFQSGAQAAPDCTCETAEYHPNILVLFGVVWCSLAQFGAKKLLLFSFPKLARFRSQNPHNTANVLPSALRTPLRPRSVLATCVRS